MTALVWIKMIKFIYGRFTLRCNSYIYALCSTSDSGFEILRFFALLFDHYPSSNNSRRKCKYCIRYFLTFVLYLKTEISIVIDVFNFAILSGV